MSLDDARELHDTIRENEDLQKQFKGLKSEAEVINKALEVADAQGVDVSRKDIEALLNKLTEQAEEMDEEELEDVAGGDSASAGNCLIIIGVTAPAN